MSPENHSGLEQLFESEFLDQHGFFFVHLLNVLLVVGAIQVQHGRINLIAGLPKLVALNASAKRLAQSLRNSHV
jgi:hypothetical protein